MRRRSRNLSGACRRQGPLTRPAPVPTIARVCTLVLGCDVLGPGTVLVAANRDEDPARPSDPPRTLVGTPRVVGGRDRIAGGTWLALRERDFVVAMLNRHRDADPLGAPAMVIRPEQTEVLPPRSRGLLALDVAQALGGHGLEIDALWDAVAPWRYEPFTLVYAGPSSRGLLTQRAGGEIALFDVPAGWHVLTHTRLDDADEPRAAALLEAVRRRAPRTIDESLSQLGELLRGHGDDRPLACIHQGAMTTVSSALVALAPGEARYLHAEGRPCEAPFVDALALASAAATGD